MTPQIIILIAVVVVAVIATILALRFSSEFAGKTDG